MILSPDESTSQLSSCRSAQDTGPSTSCGVIQSISKTTLRGALITVGDGRSRHSESVMGVADVESLCDHAVQKPGGGVHVGDNALAEWPEVVDEHFIPSAFHQMKTLF